MRLEPILKLYCTVPSSTETDHIFHKTNNHFNIFSLNAIMSYVPFIKMARCPVRCYIQLYAEGNKENGLQSVLFHSMFPAIASHVKIAMGNQ